MKTQLLLASVLCLVSWLIRTFGAIQAQRDVLHKPLVWQNPLAELLLIILFIILLFASLYLSFTGGGLKDTILILVLYFVALPVFFGKGIKSFLDKIGI